jgi:hypothetical protein
MTLEILGDKFPSLTEREKKHYLAYQRENPSSLAVSTQAQLFELYLHGKTCEEIHALNPRFPLGAIVSACIEGEWDRRKSDHLNSLFSTIRQRVEQVQLESISFIADTLSAAHKEQGEKVLRYLQTGDSSALDKSWVRSFKQYREALEILMKLTGQDKDRDPKGPQAIVNVLSGGNTKISTSESQEGAPNSKPQLTGWSPQMAAKILEAMENAEDEE